MPRRKRITLSASRLSLFEQLVEELKQLPEFDSCDFDTLELTALQLHQPFIQDIEKAIANLKRFKQTKPHLIETYAGEELTNKVQLAKMLGISRVTLNQWIAKGFIRPSVSKYTREAIFPSDSVLRQLEAYKKNSGSKL